MKTTHSIIKPVMTEKATQAVSHNVYTFQIDLKTNKHLLRETLEKMYKVKVASISILNKKGKTRRQGKRMQTTKLPDRKIAYVSLKEGSIDLFPKA